MRAIRVFETPNGRQLRQVENQTWEVQPENDNWWATGETPDEALTNAGWNVKFLDLPDITDKALFDF